MCAKCGEKDPDHIEGDCLKEIRCANNWQDHPAYARSCDVYKKEKEILPGRKGNSRGLHGRKQLCFCYTESRCNQSTHQI